ncbi:MAG: hypothetical protein M5U13_14280 [Thermoanaerobaculia bacterium]|nr:hypothetical protein [Thermoanaerobaculia bacterium]
MAADENPGALRIEGGVVVSDGRPLDLPFPVTDARLIGGRIVVLYDPMSGPRFRQFPNVEAYGPGGERLWVARHPTSETADVYVQFLSTTPLRLHSFAGFECELDPATGRIVHAVFTK